MKNNNKKQIYFSLLNDVFCSLIPYSEKIKGVDAVTVSNRTIQLLSFGIPIITKEMKIDDLL